MKRVIGWALAAVAIVGGCNWPAQDEGGGGGKAAVSGPNVQQARTNLGEAYVHAARTHAAVVRGDFDGALGAIRDVRAELTRAKQAARLDTQARINEADQEAIRVQRELERRSLSSHQTTERFADRLQGLLATMPAGEGGGAGAGTVPAEPAEASPAMP